MVLGKYPSSDYMTSSAELPPSRPPPRTSPKRRPLANQASYVTVTDDDLKDYSSRKNPLNDGGPPLRRHHSLSSTTDPDEPREERPREYVNDDPVPPIANSARPRKPLKVSSSVHTTVNIDNTRGEYYDPTGKYSADQGFPADPSTSLAFRRGPLSSPLATRRLDINNTKVYAPPPFYSRNTAAPATPSIFVTSAGIEATNESRVPSARPTYGNFFNDPSKTGELPEQDLSGYRYPRKLTINTRQTGTLRDHAIDSMRDQTPASQNDSQSKRTFQQRSVNANLGQSPYLSPVTQPRYERGSASPGSQRSDPDDYFVQRIDARSPHAGSPYTGSPYTGSSYAGSPYPESTYARSPLSPQNPTYPGPLDPTITKGGRMPHERQRRPYARNGSQGSSSNSAQSVRSDATIRVAGPRPTLVDSADAMRRREDDRREMLNSWASEMRARRGQSHDLNKFMRARFRESKSIQGDRRNCGWDRDVANEEFETRVVPSVEKEFNTVYENAIQQTYKEFMDQERDVAPGNGVEVRPSLVAWRADPQSRDSGPNGFGVVASVNLWLAGASYKMAPVEWSFGHPPRTQSARSGQALVRSERRSGDAGLYERDSRIGQSSRAGDSVGRGSDRRSENTGPSGQQLVRPSNRGEGSRTERRDGGRSGVPGTSDRSARGSSRRRSRDRDGRRDESRGTDGRRRRR